MERLSLVFDKIELEVTPDTYALVMALENLEETINVNLTSLAVEIEELTEELKKGIVTYGDGG